MIICLFGPDGAGKSTIAAKLASLLRSRGIRARVAWIRGTHSFLALLASMLSRLGVMRGDCNPYYHICVPKKARSLWFLLEVAAALPVYIMRYVVPERLGYLVIGDRCLVDFAAWLYVTLGRPRGRLSRILVSFILAEASRGLLVYLYADTRVLRERRPWEADYIDRFSAAYKALARVLPVNARMDTSRVSVEEAVDTVATLLGPA